MYRLHGLTSDKEMRKNHGSGNLFLASVTYKERISNMLDTIMIPYDSTVTGIQGMESPPSVITLAGNDTVTTIRISRRIVFTVPHHSPLSSFPFASLEWRP